MDIKTGRGSRESTADGKPEKKVKLRAPRNTSKSMSKQNFAANFKPFQFKNVELKCNSNFYHETDKEFLDFLESEQKKNSTVAARRVVNRTNPLRATRVTIDSYKSNLNQQVD